MKGWYVLKTVQPNILKGEAVFAIGIVEVMTVVMVVGTILVDVTVR